MAPGGQQGWHAGISGCPRVLLEVPSRTGSRAMSLPLALLGSQGLIQTLPDKIKESALSFRDGSGVSVLPLRHLPVLVAPFTQAQLPAPCPCPSLAWRRRTKGTRSSPAPRRSAPEGRSGPGGGQGGAVGVGEGGLRAAPCKGDVGRAGAAEEEGWRRRRSGAAGVKPGGVWAPGGAGPSPAYLQGEGVWWGGVCGRSSMALEGGAGAEEIGLISPFTCLH